MKKILIAVLALISLHQEKCFSDMLIIHGQINGRSMNQRRFIPGYATPYIEPIPDAPTATVFDATRVINGLHVDTFGDGWLLFYGKVVDETNKTIILLGASSPHPFLQNRYYPGEKFAIVNFPYHVKVGDLIPIGDDETPYFVAMRLPKAHLVLNGQEYDSVLNYYSLPDYTYHKPSAEQQAEANKRLMAELFMESTNGDASAQFNLGMHYLKGDCCETNKNLAIDWLKVSAGNGDIEASNKLSSLTIGDIAR